MSGVQIPTNKFKFEYKHYSDWKPVSFIMRKLTKLYEFEFSLQKHLSNETGSFPLPNFSSGFTKKSNNTGR